MATSVAWAVPDLQVSDFTYPTPRLNGASTNFQVIAKNNGDTTASNARVRVFLPAAFTFSSAPAGCSLSNAPYTFLSPQNPDPGAAYSTQRILTCDFPSFGAGATQTIDFTGTAAAANPPTFSIMLADVYSDIDESLLGTANDNALPKQISVNAGADLALDATTPIIISQNGAPLSGTTYHVLNGTTVTATVKTLNLGPDSTNSARVTITLPGPGNFGSAVFTGTSTSWSCSNSVGNVVTCNYSGSAVTGGNHFPDVLVTGAFTAATVGTVSFSSSIASPSNTDPNTGNNGTASVNVTLDPGIDLTANKQLLWNNAPVSTVAYGNQAIFRIGIHNNGPEALANANDAQVVDDIDAGWTIGTLPTGCFRNGQTVTCKNTAAIASGGNQNFDIPVTAPTSANATLGLHTNTATVVLLAGGQIEINTGNNTASVTYDWVAGEADLAISKTKTASQPLNDGGLITNTIVVSATSASTSYATGVITVKDTLSSFPSEQYDSFSGNGWSCSILVPGTPTDPSNRIVTCTYDTGPSGLAPSASLPALTIITKAVFGSLPSGNHVDLTNTACTGWTADNGYTLDAHPTNDCSGPKTVSASRRNSNVTLTKAVSTDDGNTTLNGAENTATYTLTIKNDSGDTIPTLTVDDNMPQFHAFPVIGTTVVHPALDVTGTGESCSVNGSTGAVSCDLVDLTVGKTRTITITVDRPMLSGTHTNTATVSSTRASLSGTLSAQATLIVNPRTNIRITKQANPGSVRVGQAVLFTLTVNADGPDNATQLKVFDAYDSNRFKIDPSYTITIDSTPAGSACNVQLVPTNWSGSNNGFNDPVNAPALVGTTGLYCNLGDVTVTAGTSTVKTIKYQAIPIFPYLDTLPTTSGGTDYVDRVYVSTSANEVAADLGNNYASASVNITPPKIDLTVSEDDAGSDPTAWGTNAPDTITYHISATSAATSQTTATGVKVVSIPTPPPNGLFHMTLSASSYKTGASYYTPTNFSCSQPGSPDTNVTCTFDDLPTGRTVGINLTYSLSSSSGSPTAAVVFQNQAIICSKEAGPTNNSDPNCATATTTNYDDLPTDNTILEKTTVLPRTDLHTYFKAADNASPDLNQLFNWTVKFRNKGPADAAGVTFTDNLPSGMRVAGTITVSKGSSVSSITQTCGAVAIGAASVTCDIFGLIPVDSNTDGSEDPNKTVTIIVPVKIDSSLTPAPIAGPYSNTACVAPAVDQNDNIHTPKLTLSKDYNSANDCFTGSINVPMRANIAGKVYYSTALTPTATVQTGGIANVTLTVTGSGTATGVTRTTKTLSDGTYSFDQLPPGTYTLTETQPASHYDGRTFMGSVTNGSLSSAAVAKVASFVASGANDSITGIVLNDNGAGVNFNFEEYRPVTISGVVYHDTNNNGVFNAESGLSGAVLQLTGTTYTGAGLSVANITTSSSGTYSFIAPPTNYTNVYTVSQITEPPNTMDGLDYDGGASTVIAGSAHADISSPRNYTDSITVAVAALQPGWVAANRNFGELLPASISGYSYIDQSNPSNAIKDVGEPALSNIVINLTGTNDLGASISQSFTTSTSTNGGRYDFTNLRPGTYTVTETQPNGLTNVGTQVGSAGNGTATGSGFTPQHVSNVVLASSSALTNYNFGHKGTVLSGFVYIDTNRDGIKNSGVPGAPDEPGIQNVKVVLSGTAWNGQNVCMLIPSCTVTTDTNGSYTFAGLPAANGAGYTLTEDNHNSPILSLYGDGAEQVGSLGISGSQSNDQHSGIPLGVNDVGSNYNFGEWGARIKGTVYFDSSGNLATNNNGSKDSGENGIPAVKVTLTGNTLGVTGLASGLVCAFMPNGICSTGAFEITTDANGDFTFDNLPAGDTTGYTLTETQPTVYQDGKETVGTIDGVTVGTAPNTGFDATAANNQISAIALAGGKQGQGYLFGELGGALSGYVYIDADNNGDKGLSEPGIQGVTVRLTGHDSSNATVNITTTTGSTGYFAFGPLPASDGSGYTLTETQPTGYLDGKEKAGTINAITVPVSLPSPDNDTIPGIVLPPGQSGINYLFGERGGTLHGFVYVDTNNSGTKDGGEAGISGVKVVLSGTLSDGKTDVCTVIPSCESITVAGANAGAFSFIVPPGTYKLYETQGGVLNAYDDGKETHGVAGGDEDNSGFGNNPGYNTIYSIVIDGAKLAANIGDIGGYLFGERTHNTTSGLVPPIISGYVYLDRNHDRIRPSATANELVSSWTVTLTAAKSDSSTEVICIVQTDSTGFYHFDNLACKDRFPQWATGLPYTGKSAGGAVTYQTFAAAFSAPGVNGFNTVPQSGGEAGVPDAVKGRIYNITLNPSDNITEQNLPIDPSGVVYDAVSRKPVANALVELYARGAYDANGQFIAGSGSLVPGSCLVSGQNAVLTGTNGFYQFLLLSGVSGCPSGTQLFTLKVTPPAGYAPRTSAMIVPQMTLLAPTIGGVYPVQPQATAPTGASVAETIYYLGLNLTIGASAANSSSNVVNNHIPLDPVGNYLIRMTKTTPLVNISRGDMVPYMVTATSTVGMTLANIDVVDQIPPGFKYRKGSATLNDRPAEPTVNGRDLTWPNLTFSGNEKKVWKLILQTGAGVGDGEYTNRAWCINNLTKGLDCNIATATVRVIPDPTFDCSDLIGKVFDDKNANGYQDEGELGIANVRLATVNGLLVTTDDQGRFHVTCADVPVEWRGSNFLMKLDERTLPTGFRVTTENPRDVRLTRGKMSKLNFGATIHRVVRLDISDAAFDATSSVNALRPEWQAQLEKLPETLKKQPSVLRIAYKLGAEGEAVAKKRLQALSGKLRALWQAKHCCHLLQIEEELIQPSPAQREAK